MPEQPIDISVRGGGRAAITIAAMYSSGTRM